MLTFLGQRASHTCDGISRRDFLRAGALGVAGLGLADWLRLRAAAAPARGTGCKSVIMIVLGGGPSHLDMYDLKPDAPAEIRGEFKPIATKVAGLDICELMPRQAQIMDQLAVIRNLRFRGDHYGTELFTGLPRPLDRARARDLRPALGSVVSRLRGTGRVPAYVSLTPSQDSFGYAKDEDPTYLGHAHRPFTMEQDSGFADLTPSNGVTVEELQQRERLRDIFDNLRRDLDTHGGLAAADSYTAQALEIIASGKTRDAFDLSREPAAVQQKYGKDPAAQRLLLARRLVEAGVGVVTVAHSGWDSHAANFKSLRRKLPVYDHLLTTLVSDLHERGLDRDVLVVAWGEFGRTPKINSKDAGRDHWPRAGFTVLAGGGLKMGQVIGATDGRAEDTMGVPYTVPNVLATIYQALGIDPSQTLPDYSGRPVHLVDDRRVVSELF